ncbi:hypothetical protein [Periweissella fabalis]|uniref:Uncharacterized protein n=1 Tax=Periweissella fabalis TaxID=1070421 RepID=A0A7X6S3B3_9LACO|nr:hypothetical protein [Periweissella fabalis]MCM0598302.1 hypothetical protein [Periweissella fabalis]NKZ24934.1 hypothetical protein [Periweissella fabalis]
MTTKDERFEKCTELIDSIEDTREAKLHDFIDSIGEHHQDGYVKFIIKDPDNATELLEKINELTSKLDDVEVPQATFNGELYPEQIVELIKLATNDTKIIKQIEALIEESDVAELDYK